MDRSLVVRGVMSYLVAVPALNGIQAVLMLIPYAKEVSAALRVVAIHALFHCALRASSATTPTSVCHSMEKLSVPT